MNTMKLTCLYGVTAICGVFILAHITRSILLKNSLSRDTMKMYLTAFLGTVVADLALAGALAPEALTAILGAIIGGFLGAKGSKAEEE